MKKEDERHHRYVRWLWNKSSESYLNKNRNINQICCCWVICLSTHEKCLKIAIQKLVRFGLVYFFNGTLTFMVYFNDEIWFICLV